MVNLQLYNGYVAPSLQLQDDYNFADRYGPRISDEMLSPMIKKAREVDDIENVTLLILLNLLSCTDRIKRTEIKEAIPNAQQFNVEINVEDNSLFDAELFTGKTKSPQRFNPFREETNFAPEVVASENVVRTHHVVHKFFLTLAKVLFGYEYLNANQDPRTVEKMLKDLNADRQMWEKGLWRYYNPIFNGKMSILFGRIDLLLETRQNFAKKAYYQRITLYVSVIVNCVGILLGKKVIMFFGLTASVITLAAIIRFYATNSFKFNKLETNLSASIGDIIKETSTNRVNLVHIDPMLLNRDV